MQCTEEDLLKLFTKLLKLAYAAGVNDGMREAIPGRSKEIEGEDRVVERCMNLVDKFIQQ